MLRRHAGRRFYGLQFVPTQPLSPVTHINLITNWFEELKAKVLGK